MTNSLSNWITEKSLSFLSLLNFFFLIFIFLLFRAAHGTTWNFLGGRSNRSHSCRPTPQPQQRRILNPLNEARDQTRILTGTSHVG